MIRGAKPIYDDRLVAVFELPDGRLARQGKRVGKCSLTKDERRAYVKGGAVAAIKLIRSSRRVLLSDAIEILEHGRKTGRRVS